MAEQRNNGPEKVAGGARDTAPASSVTSLEKEQLLAELEPARHSLPSRHREIYRPADFSAEDDNAWVLTYIDVLTLLLTLFVVLLAYAKTDAEKYRQLSEAVSKEMGQVERPVAKPISEQERLFRELSRNISQQGMGSNVEVLAKRGTVELRMKESILFPSAQARLMLQGEQVLDKLVPLLEQGRHAISVEGHTDNVPIDTPQFPSNWELSSARASTVVRHLIARGIPANRLTAVGYADTRPLADNDTAEGRARNRRVSIIIAVTAQPPPDDTATTGQQQTH